MIRSAFTLGLFTLIYSVPSSLAAMDDPHSVYKPPSVNQCLGRMTEGLAEATVGCLLLVPPATTIMNLRTPHGVKQILARIRQDPSAFVKELGYYGTLALSGGYILWVGFQNLASGFKGIAERMEEDDE